MGKGGAAELGGIGLKPWHPLIFLENRNYLKTIKYLEYQKMFFSEFNNGSLRNIFEIM